MIEIFKNKTTVDFVKLFPVAGPISAVLVLLSLFFIFRQITFGVDFKGGAEIQLRFSPTSKVTIDQIRSVLDSTGNARTAIVQSLSDEIMSSEKAPEFLVKASAGQEENLNPVTDAIGLALQKSFVEEGIEIVKVDIVGPKAGETLRNAGILSLFWALIIIMIYIWLRFDFEFSPGAILALIHDVLITLGVFSLFRLEFSLQTVAALLTVIGYSVNDTVIIYDRIRENFAQAKGSLEETLNLSINQTLSRTILTAGTTLIVSLIMFFMAGKGLRDFFLAISLGIVVGTYSSIFLAAPITLWLRQLSKRRKKA